MKITELNLNQENLERQKELNLLNNPELIRFCVHKIKQLEHLRVPPFELPAESWIRSAVIEILLEAESCIDSIKNQPTLNTHPESEEEAY